MRKKTKLGLDVFQHSMVGCTCLQREMRQTFESEGNLQCSQGNVLWSVVELRRSYAVYQLGQLQDSLQYDAITVGVHELIP